MPPLSISFISLSSNPLPPLPCYRELNCDVPFLFAGNGYWKWSKPHECYFTIGLKLVPNSLPLHFPSLPTPLPTPLLPDRCTWTHLYHSSMDNYWIQIFPKIQFTHFTEKVNNISKNSKTKSIEYQSEYKKAVILPCSLTLYI